MSEDFLSAYKKKVKVLVANSTPVDDLNITTQSQDLNDYKEKVRLAGLSPDQSQSDTLLQYKSLLDALSHSYNTERIKFVIDPINLEDDEEFLALIEKKQESFSTDQESIGMDFNNSPIAVGKTIDWIRTGFKYLVFQQDLSVRGYFSGKIKRANYLIKWTDDNGNIYQQWCAIEGPSEEDAGFRNNSISVDTGGNQIYMYLGKTDATQYLKRYNRLIVKDPAELGTANQSKVLVRAWRIDVIDDISNKYMIKLSLTENYINRAELTDSEVYGIAYNDINHSYTYNVPFGSSMATGYVLYKENISLYQDGKILDITPENFNVYVNGSLVNDLQPFNVAGDYFIKITANGYPEDAVFGQTISFSNVGATMVYEIRGSNRIKAYETYTYESKAIINGAHVGTTGSWSFSNPSVIKGYTTNGDSISLVVKDRLGNFDLTFTDPNGTHTKNITIISMLLDG